MLGKKYRILKKSLTVYLFAFAVLMVTVVLNHKNLNVRGDFYLLIVLLESIPFVVIAIIVVSFLKKKITVENDRIKYAGLFGNIELIFSQIKGFKRNNDNGKESIVLISKDGNNKIDIVDSFERYDELKSWVEKSFADLDNQEESDDKKAVLRDMNAGSGKIERTEGFLSLNNIAIAINVFTVIVGVATYISLILSLSSPFSVPQYLKLLVAICSILPFIAIFLNSYSKGLITLWKSKGSKRRHMTYTLVIPVIVLQPVFYDNSHFLHFVSYAKIVMPAAIVMLLILSVMYLYFRSSIVKTGNSPKQIAGVIFFLMLFSWFFVETSNWVFDASRPTVYMTKVLDKQISTELDSDNNPKTYYRLTLDRWGPVNESNVNLVDFNLYEKSKIGDQFKISLYAGLYDVPYYICNP